jgi:FkbH-like protein
MVAQRAAGRLLCVASRNAEADVRDAFEALSMPIAFEDLAAHRIGWQPKSQSLRSLADELGLGLDSFIFIDNDLAECEQVRAHCPEVSVVQLSPDARDIAATLDRTWSLDITDVTADDRWRAARYRTERARQRELETAISPEEFLRSLAICIDIAPLGPRDLDRAAQLTQRTNQFNLTTRRRTAGHLATMLRRTTCEGFAVRVHDRLGDYGLVGLMLVEGRQDTLEVDTFLLSCRVLNRRVEAEMLRWLGQHACESGYDILALPLRAVERNVPAQRFVESVGGASVSPRSDGLVMYSVRLAELTARAGSALPRVAVTR